MTPQSRVPLGCPCCGSDSVYTGHTEATRVGVICKQCGLSLSREYPDHWPRGIARTGAALDQYLLKDAITAWNRRKSNG